MHADASHSAFSPRPTGSILGFLLFSILMHVLILVFWSASPPGGMPGGGVLQVRLAPGVARSGDADSIEQANAAADAAQTTAGESANRAMIPAGTVIETTTRIKHASSPLPGVARESEASVADTASPLPGQTQTQQTAAITRSTAANHPSTAAQAPTNGPSADQAGGPAASSPVTGEHGGTDGDTSQRIEAALRRALLPHFDYPLLARRRGWEGRVRIALLVQPDGDLTDMHVLESSGYRILDNAALEDLRQVGRLPEATVWLSGQQLGVILPIHYRFR